MMNRRTMLTAALAATVTSTARAFADGGMSRISAYAFSFPALSGDNIRLAAFTGKPLLVVNTASLCGYTPQYAGLQELWSEFRERGLTVIGVPSNDFGGQEPGSNREIKTFCEVNFDVDFPLTEKVQVTGARSHPLFAWLRQELGEGAGPRWNFHKYLIAPDGRAVAAWPSSTDPQSAAIRAEIERLLQPPS